MILAELIKLTVIAQISPAMAIMTPETNNLTGIINDRACDLRQVRET